MLYQIMQEKAPGSKVAPVPGPLMGPPLCLLFREAWSIFLVRQGPATISRPAKVSYHPLFTSGLQGADRHTKITAIRMLGADGSGGTGGVRVKMQAKAGKLAGAARYMEVCVC